MSINTLLADEATWYPLLFDTPKNAAGCIFFWLVIAFALIFCLYMLLIRGEARKVFLKASVFVALAVACVIGFTMLALSLFEDGIVEILFYPILVLIATVAGSAIVLYFFPSKRTFLLTGCIVGIALLSVLICTGIHFSSGDAAEDNWITNDDVNSVALYISAVLVVAAIVTAGFLLDRKTQKGFDAKSIAYAAICIAMSFALSWLRIVKMPQGGSITIASLLPMMVYSYMFGTKKGVFAGFVYGLLQAVQDPYILHPAQFILDYPAAFASIGLSGMFADFRPLEKRPQIQIALGGIVAGIGRFAIHFLSGIFAFGAYAGSEKLSDILLYSLTYNAGYVLPDIVIAIVASVLVFSSPAFVRQVRKVRPAEKSAISEKNPETETPSV